ncbi:FKBP-type peptidyl-prolyl cis-trans isomerase [Solirubrobacter taibaiensis]|nr:FKBP-type peptidyl-prolyl cis-trans isomerase [Solirubrobacter taibaiensis]
MALALAFAACGDDEPETAATPAPTEEAAAAPTEEAAPAATPADDVKSSSDKVEVEGDVGEKPVIKVPGGEATELISEDIEEGKGAEAKAGDTVQVQYSGVLLADGTPFDNSFDRGEPFEFQLGAGMVIPGWDQGVAGMKEGGRRVLTIPSDLGYGDAGAPPTIPPGAGLVFVVDLEKINP